MIKQAHSRRLSNAQSVLLQLFERDLPEEDLLAVRNMLTTYFFKKAEKEADKAIKQKSKTIKQVHDELDDLNNESRTERRKKIKV